MIKLKETLQIVQLPNVETKILEFGLIEALLTVAGKLDLVKSLFNVINLYITLSQKHKQKDGLNPPSSENFFRNRIRLLIHAYIGLIFCI